MEKEMMALDLFAEELQDQDAMGTNFSCCWNSAGCFGSVGSVSSTASSGSSVSTASCGCW